MLSNLLIFRMAIANVCWAVALACVWQAGYVKTLFTTDSTNISYGIAALFVVGLISTFHRALKVSAANAKDFFAGFAVAVLILSFAFLCALIFGWVLFRFGPLPAAALVIIGASGWVGFAFASDQKKKREDSK